MKILKWILIIVGGGFALYVVGSIIALIVLFAQFDSSSYEGLTSNYEKKTREIREVRDFINSILPENIKIDIEFERYGSISRFSMVKNKDYENGLSIWDKSVDEEDIFNALGWDDEIVTSLRNKLDDAGCISIESGNPCQIGFQRHGMGMYFYNLFDEPVPDSLYNDSCRYILYKKDVVLEWGGGAIGVQCFPELRNR